MDCIKLEYVTRTFTTQGTDVVMHEDSTVRCFDLAHLSYPRDLMSAELLRLKQEITEECRKTD